MQEIQVDSDVEIVLLQNQKYFNKARILCKESIDRTKYPRLVKSLEGFITTIVETSSHLEKLQVCIIEITY